MSGTESFTSGTDPDPADPAGPGDPAAGSPPDRTVPDGALRQYPCSSCGARLTYAPGTTTLRCPYCGHEEHLAAAADDTVQEHSYQEWLARAGAGKPVGHVAPTVVRCSGCGAQTETAKLSDACPFCGAPIVVQ